MLHGGALPLQAAEMPQVHHRLQGGDKLLVLSLWLIKKDVHVEAAAFLGHGLTDTPSPNDGYGLAGHLVAQKRQIGMPESPLIFTNQLFGGPQPTRQGGESEEGKLGRRLRQHVRSVSERN